jgi:3-oxoacyl-[acyl-carrier-protein] synthase II
VPADGDAAVAQPSAVALRRVVVTGLGLVTPLGCGVEVVWRRLIEGRSGLRRIDRFDVEDLPAKVAGLVPSGAGEGDFRIDEVVAPKEARKNDLFIIYGMAAATEAVRDAGWQPEDAHDREQTGVLIGSGIGGLSTIADTAVELEQRGPRRVSPFFIPASLINLVSGQVSIRFGFKGPNHSVVTACSTGAHAIGDAARLIALGDAEVMIAGGAEAAICRLGMAGFAAARALSTRFNDTPERASRPWDQDRDGFVMGEGAGIVVLEELQHARARGARIYGELVGYGLSGDAYHITAPSPDGEGGYRSMQAALKRAGMTPDAIDYINAHGTSTPLGDEIELGAVKRLFGDAARRLSMSSTKSAIGHLLGAAGSVEAIFSLLALHHQTVPPTLNLDRPSPGCDLDLVPYEARRRDVRAVLSNSFGFGGTNASLIFARPPGH